MEISEMAIGTAIIDLAKTAPGLTMALGGIFVMSIGLTILWGPSMALAIVTLTLGLLITVFGVIIWIDGGAR
jgi:uncharacterized membrane protein HdeD (DUF308 family)